MGLQIVGCRADLLLFDAILEDPDFRTVVIRTVANHDDLEKRLIGLQVDLIVKLGDERAQFLQVADANLLEVAFAGSGCAITMRTGGEYAGDVAIQANGFGSGGNLPFGGAEEDTDVIHVHFRDARWNGLGLKRLVDGAEDDAIACHVDDHATARKIGDDFVALGEGATGESEQRAEEAEDENQTPH